MKKFVSLLAVLGLFICSVSSTHAITVGDSYDQIQYQAAFRNMSAMPLAFTENQGQWDSKVHFRTNAGGATMWFASDGAYYKFTQTVKSKDTKECIENQNRGATKVSISGREVNCDITIGSPSTRVHICGSPSVHVLATVVARESSTIKDIGGK